jgi:hypothetical protein
VQIAPGFSFFYVGGPFPSARSGGAICDIGYLVPQPFVARGNPTVSRFVMS